MQIQICMDPPVVSQINIVIFIHGKRTVYQRGMLWKNLQCVCRGGAGRPSRPYILPVLYGHSGIEPTTGHCCFPHFPPQRHIKLPPVPALGPVHHSAPTYLCHSGPAVHPNRWVSKVRRLYAIHINKPPRSIPPAGDESTSIKRRLYDKPHHCDR